MKHANPELERLVLGALLDAEGALLRSNASSILGSTGLRAEDITTPEVRTWFECVRTLAERQRPADSGTVWGLSRGMGGVPADGFGTLELLQGSNSVNRPTLQAHADELKRLTQLRRLETHVEAMRKRLAEPRADPTAIAGELDTFAREFSGGADRDGTGADDVYALSEEWEQAAMGKRKPYLPTGILALDAHVMGWEENLNIVGGQPSIGKSALIAPAILNALEAGHSVGLFGLEDGTKWVAKRLVAHRTGLPLKAVGKARMHDHQAADVSKAMSSAYQLLGNMVTCTRGGLTTSELMQRAKRWVHERKVRAIFIDHGLEIQHEGRSKADDMRLRVANTFQQLRDLAVSTHTPVIVVVHTNREAGKEQGPPTQHSFAECAGIERMARLALGLWTRDGDAADTVRCTVVKQTEGERNVTMLLKRHVTAAMVSNHGGIRIDLAEERKQEQEAKRRAKGQKAGLW